MGWWIIGSLWNLGHQGVGFFPLFDGVVTLALSGTAWKVFGAEDLLCLASRMVTRLFKSSNSLLREKLNFSMTSSASFLNCPSSSSFFEVVFCTTSSTI